MFFISYWQQTWVLMDWSSFLSLEQFVPGQGQQSIFAIWKGGGGLKWTPCVLDVSHSQHYVHSHGGGGWSEEIFVVIVHLNSRKCA